MTNDDAVARLTYTDAAALVAALPATDAARRYAAWALNVLSGQLTDGEPAPDRNMPDSIASTVEGGCLLTWSGPHSSLRLTIDADGGRRYAWARWGTDAGPRDPWHLVYRVRDDREGSDRDA